ncbi:MAG: ATP-dependent helicase HrpB [Nitrospirota bacterium]
MNSYPIDTILPELKKAVQNGPSVIVHAPPGAGKTTRVPLALLDVIPREQGRIIMLEPRRIAAVSAARWMARTVGEEVGGTVGYAIRFDSRSSARTRIEVVTEGILTRRIQVDPGLAGVAMVIFDEFHERSLHADLALALALDVRKGLRPDLKVLVMSATMDTGPIASLLGDAAVVTSTGKAFPVEERYMAESTLPVHRRVAAAVRTALRETSGDILAFLPGSGEIRSCARELQEGLDLTEERIALHPLYGDLPFEEQERAILPSRERRKIVLATNIAETSLTIEGVHVVIDSGLTRGLRYDPSTGMNRLVTMPVSRAAAEQRKGRAGRLGPGVCYRLYSRHDLQGMPPFAQPEILVSDLAPLALELAAWGVKDPATLTWLDVPPVAAWESGIGLLKDLGALDRTGSVTPQGRSMARLPLHPRLARLMVRAGELGCLRLGADLAAILSERDIFRQIGVERVHNERDVSERLDMLRRWRNGTETSGAANPQALRTVERTARQLLSLVPGRPEAADRVHDETEMISRLLLCAFPDRICKRREEGGGRFVLVQGRGVRLSTDSGLGASPYIIAVNLDAGEKTEGFVHVAAPVTEELIRSECGGRIETVRRVEWDSRAGRIAAALEERLEALLLSQSPFKPSDEEAGPILCEAIRTTPGILSFSKDARQLQARASMIRKAFPEESWPDLTDEQLLSHPEEWILPWLTDIRSAQSLGSLNVLPAMKAKLNREQQRFLEERAPLAITVPSSSRITIDYTAGDIPVLAVKLQEMFGCADTPVIAGGRVKVLLHLLSPARRPVQVTQDLKGFWNSGYVLVKKDLKGRYPRHPWPDDPWNAVPTRRAKPRGT